MIRIGVAGWDYADWNGIVYPHASRGIDRLAHLARFVDVIEINSTFYRPARPSVAASWVARTRDRTAFRFTAKAHRSWTHETDADPAAVVGPTLAGLEPLREAGRLGGLLLQFPQSFHFEPPALERLDRLLDRLEGWPVVVEVRHASWEADEAGRWLGDRSVSWCAVDQPRVGRSTARLLPRATGPVGYLRLHGRNRHDWFRPEAGRDARYDYRYSERELGELVPPVLKIAGAAAEVYVVQNNHFRGQAVANALQLRHLVDGTRPAAPDGLVDAYPELASSVEVRRDRLF